MDNNYKIKIDGDWSLEDLHIFPHLYSQIYGFIFSIHLIVERKLFEETEYLSFNQEKMLHTFKSQPWKRGYSSINFYNYLKNTTPIEAKPRIIAIHYESPGFIELSLIVPVAKVISSIINSLCSAGKSINHLYTEIYKGMKERELIDIDVRERRLTLAKAELKFINESSSLLAKMMGFKNLNELNRITNNPLATLKILLSFYRKIKILSEFNTKEKIKL